MMSEPIFAGTAKELAIITVQNNLNMICVLRLFINSTNRHCQEVL